jgi:hypothetical protein
MDADRFWKAIIPWAARERDNRLLAEKSLAAAGKATVSAATVDHLASCVGAVEQAVYALWPRLEEELRLRERPIREQWESRGPGLLRRVGKLMGTPFVAQADIALVEPCLGGGGAAHPAHSLVHLEAVLANPWAVLPEPVRLGWLLTQLGTGADTPPERAPVLCSLATLPVVLEAAEYVEWTRFDRETLQHGLEAWRPAAPAGMTQDELSASLIAWRNECVERSLAWGDAVRLLDQRLPS